MMVLSLWMALSPAEGFGRRTGLLCPVLAVGLMVAPVVAQHYPDRLLEVIVPFALGWGADTVARAVAGSERSKFLPDLPTVAEGGYPDFAADSWNGIFAPAGTPPEIIAKLNQATVTALSDPQVAQRMESEGDIVMANAFEEFAAYVAAEHAKWNTVIAALPSGISLD